VKILWSLGFSLAGQIRLQLKSAWSQIDTFLNEENENEGSFKAWYKAGMAFVENIIINQIWIFVAGSKSLLMITVIHFIG
jgi:hypothetical protein